MVSGENILLGEAKLESERKEAVRTVSLLHFVEPIVCQGSCKGNEKFVMHNIWVAKF
jgi:hypothetical protein